MKLLDYARGQSREIIILVGLFLVAVVGVLDYVTGPEIGFSIFYLIPICLVAGYVSRAAGLAFALLSAIAWLGAELLWKLTYSHAFVPFWNAAVRMALFSVSGALTAEVANRNKIEATMRQQTSILKSILNSMGDGVIVTDAGAKVLVYNPAAERLLGTSLKNGAPFSWLKEQGTFVESLPAYPAHEHPLFRAITGESVDGAEMSVRNGEGRPETWLNVNSRPLIDEQGKLQGGVVVFSDITPRKLLEKQISEISDREQRRIGEDLHDGLCQHLVSTGFASTVLKNKLEEQGVRDAASAQQISDLINDAITQARDLARGLYPVRLEEDGLASALEQLMESLQNRTNITCTFLCEQPVLIHDQVAATNLYRIAQEAVNNAVKHSQSKTITVELEAVEDEVTLTISDNGIGFPSVLKKNTMGVSIMNYRARLIGASFDIRRSSSGGTTVTCSFLNTKHPNTNERQQTTAAI